jgi:hypothetical protein
MLKPALLLLAPVLLGSCAFITHSRGDAGWNARFVDPLTAPTQFESPVIATSIRPIAVNHALPDASIFAGGDIQIIAVQARVALTERLALIATKDGYVMLNPDAGADENGLADLAAGFKYALVDNPDAGVLVTPGLIYELASGDEEVFQGNGDGVLRPFVSAGWDLGRWNLLGAVGYDFPLDGDAETSRVDYHVHADFEAGGGFYPLVEINGIRYLDDAAALAVDFEGGDFFNLGASDVDGNSVTTGAIGMRWRTANVGILGLGYEAPLTSREDLFDWRLTLDWIFWL